MVKNTKITEYIRTLHHKKTVRAITTTSVLLGLPVVGAYSYFIGVKRVKIDYVPFVLKNKMSQLQGMKMIHISDLHYGPTNKDKKHFNRIVDLINTQKADIIVITGDYYQWDPQYLYELPQMLKRLRAKIGVFGCLGNHDYGSCYPGKIENDPFEHEITKDALEREGLRILTNEAVTLEHKKQKFNLVGLHDLWSNKCDPDVAFKNINQKLPTFVLSHNPDTINLVKQDFDLMLSGHSHGGQLNWPVVGAFLLPQKDRKYTRGLHNITKRKSIYINRGLGQTFRMRINSAPEITLFDFVD